MKPLRIAAIALAGFVAFAPVRAQQTTTPQHQHDPAAPPQQTATPPEHQHDQTAPQTGGAMQHGQMDHGKMMADMKATMKANDARLQSLVETMKSSKGDEKVRAIEEVVTQLVNDQLAMHRHMEMMHEHMMGQMSHK